MAMMRSFLIMALFCLVGWSNGQKCPAQYYKFTPYHSFCLPPNPSCQIKGTGVSQQDKEVILDLHNQLRSKVAMGNERRARDGSLPQAADMIQMVWDDELANIAQKWTENCNYYHDCNKCRQVENFLVGQNIAITNTTTCNGCPKPSGEPEWARIITAFYDEVLDFYVGWLRSFKDHPGYKVGHMTQIIWSQSWRIGCGYSFYFQFGEYHQFYACNYGPTGNMQPLPVYKQGQPCSACPTNSHCSLRKTGPNTYPGLCRMINPNSAPVYPVSKNGLLFYCSADGDDPDCMARATGDGRWETVHTPGGNYRSLVLSGGQSQALTFKNEVKPRGSNFCVVLNFRKGPLDGSEWDTSSFKTDFKMEHSYTDPSELNVKPNEFQQYSLNIPWNQKTRLGFTFSVPRQLGEHYLDIKTIEAYEGSCDSRMS